MRHVESLRRPLAAFPLALALALALGACGAVPAALPAANVAATSTPRPTWTPLPEEPTPIPTPIPALPEQTPRQTAELLKGALDATLAVERYRLEFSLAAKNYERRRSADAPPPRLGKVMAQLDLDQKEPLMTVTGEYSGDSSRTTTIYHCVGCEEGEADKTYDLLAAGGALYMWDDSSETWYIIDASLAADALPALEGHSLLRQILNARVDLAAFQPSANQSLDGMACTVYADYQQAAIKALFGMGESFGENEDALFDEAVNSVQADESVLRLWACEDGLIHRVALDISGFLKEDQSQAFALSQQLYLYDVDAKIAIDAPRNAVNLDFGDWMGEDLTATVFNGGNVRAAPSMDGEVLGQISAGETVFLYEKSPDGRWYYIGAAAVEGWAHSSLLTIDPAVAAQVPVTGESYSEPSGDALTATVFNGGNVRAAPNTGGAVLDQINAGETVELLAKTGDGVWYEIYNARGVVGWVHSSLLTIDPAVAARVPAEGMVSQ